AGGLHLPQLSVPDGEIVALACADARDAEAVIGAVAGDRDGGARVGTRPITPADRLGLRADLLVEPHVVDRFDGTLREHLATSAPCARPARRTCWRSFPSATTRTSWIAARTSRAGTVNASPWPGRSPPTPRCWCCTTRPLRSTPSPSRASPRRWSRPGAAPTGPRSWSPARRRCCGKRTGWCSCGAARSSARERTAS